MENKSISVQVAVAKVPPLSRYPFRLFCGRMSVKVAMILSVVTTSMFACTTLSTLIYLLNGLLGEDSSIPHSSPTDSYRWYLLFCLAIMSFWLVLILQTVSIVIGLMLLLAPTKVGRFHDLNASNIALCLSFFFIFASLGPMLKKQNYDDNLAWWLFGMILLYPSMQLYIVVMSILINCLGLSLATSLNAALNCYIWWANATSYEWHIIMEVCRTGKTSSDHLQYLRETTKV